MRISDWSSDVCSSDLYLSAGRVPVHRLHRDVSQDQRICRIAGRIGADQSRDCTLGSLLSHRRTRSEEHTSELQSLMRISYAVFCLKKKKITNTNTYTILARV